MLLEDRIARAAESVGNRFVGIEVNPRVVVRVRVGTDRQHVLESPDRVMDRTLSGAGYLAHVLPIHACLPGGKVDG
jgi:hypothetical protein